MKNKELVMMKLNDDELESVCGGVTVVDINRDLDNLIKDIPIIGPIWDLIRKRF